MCDDKTRALLIRIRGLLLLAVDLIERYIEMGRYAPPKPVTITPVDSIAGIMPAGNPEPETT